MIPLFTVQESDVGAILITGLIQSIPSQLEHNLQQEDEFLELCCVHVMSRCCGVGWRLVFLGDFGGREMDDFITLSSHVHTYFLKKLTMARDVFCLDVSMTTHNTNNGQCHSISKGCLYGITLAKFPFV